MGGCTVNSRCLQELCGPLRCASYSGSMRRFHYGGYVITVTVRRSWYTELGGLFRFHAGLGNVLYSERTDGSCGLLVCVVPIFLPDPLTTFISPYERNWYGPSSPMYHKSSYDVFITAQIISGFISFGSLHIKTNRFEPWQWYMVHPYVLARSWPSGIFFRLMIITGIITLLTALAFL